MSFANGGRIVTDGLVLSLDASDRNSYVSGSSTWNDLSGNGNNGTLVNGPTFDSGSNGSIIFNGTSNYINCGYIMNFASSFTLELAFKTTFTGSQTIICSKYDYTDPNFWFGLNNNKLTFSISLFSPGKAEPASISNVNDGSWYIGHAVYDSTTYTARVYLNSILQNSVTGNVAFVDTNRSYYIARFNPTSIYFPGTIAFNKIYNRALLASEVLQNYNASKSRFNLT
jgi:hypothetical protein